MMNFINLPHQKCKFAAISRPHIPTQCQHMPTQTAKNTQPQPISTRTRLRKFGGVGVGVRMPRRHGEENSAHLVIGFLVPSYPLVIRAASKSEWSFNQPKYAPK